MIHKYLNKMNTRKYDIALYKKNKLLETGTSNLLFVKKNKIYSPINNYYKGTTLKFFYTKIKIHKRNIYLKSLGDYEEIIIIGSGKGVVSTYSINNFNWKRKSLKYYRLLSKIYQQNILKYARYYG